MKTYLVRSSVSAQWKKIEAPNKKTAKRLFQWTIQSRNPWDCPKIKDLLCEEVQK